MAVEIERTNALQEILKLAAGVVGDYAEQPLGIGAGGVNIEGLAYLNDHVFVGLRGPSMDGSAFILSVKAEALFSGEAAKADVIEIQLGESTGVRDLAAVSDGLVVLAGPVQSGGGYALHYLDLSDGTVKKLIDLKMPEDQKAETVLVLEEDTEMLKLLVMYDGASDGGPREYHVSR